MEHIGYKLIDGEGVVINSWGGIFGQCPPIPNVIILANGDHQWCPQIDRDYGGCQLIKWIEEEPLADIKARVKRQISLNAEAARAKYLTEGSLKAMSYLKVAQEAATYVATNGAGAYPLLQARVNSGRYPDLAAAVSGTLAIENTTTAAGAQIDEIEDRAKLQIDAATTQDQVLAASNVIFP